MSRIIPILLVFLLLPLTVFALDVEVEVASYRSGKTVSLGPENLMDNDPSTVWVGNSSSGSSEWIELHFAEPTQVERLGFYNGHQGGLFSELRRIRSARIIYPDGKGFRFWLRDEMGEQVVYCLGIPVTNLRIEIDSVSPHSRENFTGEVAVSEIKLYISIAPKAKGVVNDVATLNRVRDHLSSDPERVVPEEVVRLLRMFYYRQATMAEDYAELFAEDVQDQNGFQFEVFKEMQRQRGVYHLLKDASVNASGLGFEKVEQSGDYMRVRVFGSYHIWVGELDRRLEEESIFVLAKEHGAWKILELEEE
jgi:hypothetical protein